jgi:hypothetical protein
VETFAFEAAGLWIASHHRLPLSPGDFVLALFDTRFTRIGGWILAGAAPLVVFGTTHHARTGLNVDNLEGRRG